MKAGMVEEMAHDPPGGKGGQIAAPFAVMVAHFLALNKHRPRRRDAIGRRAAARHVGRDHDERDAAEKMLTHKIDERELIFDKRLGAAGGKFGRCVQFLDDLLLKQ